MSFGSESKLTWLGHATFLYESGSGEVAIIDPWLSGNPKCPESFHELDRLDAILITHGHFDHIQDAASLAKKHDAKVIAIFEIAHWLGQQGVPEEQLVGMNKGGRVNVFDGLDVTMVNAFHSGGIVDSDGNLVYGGEPAGFVLHPEDGVTIYLAGDTCLFGDLALYRELYRPRVAVLPIGGHFTMGPEDAARAARMLGARVVVPCHYGTFPVLAGTPDELAEALGGEGEVIAVEPGQAVP